MTDLNRRQLLGGSLAALALAGCGRGPKKGSPEPSGPATSNPTPHTKPISGPAASAIILLYMEGGPSQLDTWDPKPGTEGAAGVKAINTKVPGLALSEYLPNIAKQANKLAVLRSLSSKEGNHARARHLMHTGYVPAGGVEHPALGAIADAELSKGALPGYISIGGAGAGAGFLGAAHAPFAVIDPQKPVRNLGRHRSVTPERFNARLAMWRELEADFAKSHPSEIVKSQRDVGERAVAMMNAAEVVAFDLDKETAKTREAFGDNRFGQGCLMARRLVTAGVPFVEVAMRGWDTHLDHSTRIKNLTSTLDRGMSALLADLETRGMLDTTLVVWAGDFGRTPWISARGGRDHYPKVSSAVFAGGGVRGGQVIGATDERGHEVVGEPLTVPDLFRSMTEAVGLDAAKTRFSRSGRPLSTTDGGRVIEGLFKTA